MEMPVVTVSVGVAFTHPHNSKRDMQGFLRLADEALYKAKAAGRNRAVLAISGDGHTSTGIFESRASPTAGEQR